MGYRRTMEDNKREGNYIEHNAGDVSSFRYPHARQLASSFAFDEGLKYWRLRVEGVTDGGLSAARALAVEDITLYEFLSPAARRIHCLDMVGLTADEELREQAFDEVSCLYERREKLADCLELHSVRLTDISSREGFGVLSDLYQQIADVPVRVLTVDASKTGVTAREAVVPWPFGSVLKGTDIVVTDGNPLNLGQDLLHALYHLQEGIPGVDDDNCFVRELWAPVPALYALQLAEGRLSRRRRLRPSPHPIHFTDYIYLRAYLGQGLARPVADPYAHPAYAVIEPSLRLMFHALADKDAEARHRILADAVLCDRHSALVDCFERRFGEGSFAAIYDTYDLYDKYQRALMYVDERELDRIMFEDGRLIPSDVPMGIVERLWKEEGLRARPREVLGLLGFAED